MITTSVGNLNFISQNKIVCVDLKQNGVQYGVLNSGQICGSSVTRKPQEKKAPRGKKYTLPDNLDYPPKFYPHLYYQVRVLDTCKPNEIKQTSFLDNQDPKNDYVKNTKIIHCLQKDSYFYWTDNEFNSLPHELKETFIQMESEKKYTVPFESRDFKKMSHRTRSKIQSKLLQWQSGILDYHKGDKTRCNMYFLTFTIPTRNFSHELTAKAWRNFLKNMGMKYQAPNKPVNYLWVAELQSGKRSSNTANEYFKMYQKGGVHSEYYKSKYQLFTEKALNPTNNIHYHMVVDRFYDVKELQDLWLTCLENVGCSRYTSTGAPAQPLMAEKVKGSNNAVGRYIAKYVSKNDGELKCQLWNCSRKISALATSLADCYLVMDKINAHWEAIEKRSLILCKIALEKFKKSAEYFTRKVLDNGNMVFYFNNTPKWLKKLCKPLIDFNVNVLFGSSPLSFFLNNT